MAGSDATPIALITGAAGNLGSRLARHLAARDRRLRLLVHRTPLPEDLRAAPNVTSVHGDLARPETLVAAVDGCDAVVHFAGVLFAPRPETFLPETNTRWFANLLDASIRAGVGRVILVSFPHVEGRTSVENPATGETDREPPSVHARTRLQEERLLLDATRGTGTTPVILRLGMVYGPGILMIEAARWLARRRLLAVWREPTWIHLISTTDYLAAAEAAVVKPVGRSPAMETSAPADLRCRGGVRSVGPRISDARTAHAGLHHDRPRVVFRLYCQDAPRSPPGTAISEARRRA